MKLNSIDEILSDIRAGRMVVIMDDEDRENEGDLIMAAELARAEDVNFMARYARGLICLTLTRDRCRQLRLPLMVSETNVDHRTNFTLSIEAAEGVTTGISAHDRAQTIRAAVKRDAKPEDLRQPGHIFPIMAQPGGVLTRAGHTEAGCDLTRLAGLEPAAVIVEILKDDGTMARRPDLEKFAQQHRPQDRHDRRPDPLSAGQGALGRAHRRAGDPARSSARSACTATRITSIARCTSRWSPVSSTARACRSCACICATRCGDVVGIHDPALGWPLRSAMQRIAQEGSGVIVLLRPEETPRDLMEAVQSINQPRPRAAATGRGQGAAHLRHRRADPARPGRLAHARPVGAEADARPVGVRSRGRRVRRPVAKGCWALGCWPEHGVSG